MSLLLGLLWQRGYSKASGVNCAWWYSSFLNYGVGGFEHDVKNNIVSVYGSVVTTRQSPENISDTSLFDGNHLSVFKHKYTAKSSHHITGSITIIVWPPESIWGF
jgi:hypothetical protein